MTATLAAAPARAHTDIHQHLWLPEFVDALRSRRDNPRVVGTTLLLDGEPAYEIPAHAMDPERRLREEGSCSVIVLGLSSPLGIEALPAAESHALLDGWHGAVAALPAPFLGWASVNRDEPDPDGLARRLAAGFAGLQIPAGELATPAAVERLAPVLAVAQASNRPVMVHPGPVSSAAGRAPGGTGLPPWWPAVVDYPAQLQAAWWSWHVAGRALLPTLRICFAAGAGLAPVHRERFSARGGGRYLVDPLTFVDTSSYGRQGQDSLIRVLGVDQLVLGSDRPYATAADPGLGDAATNAIRSVNPRRLLWGDAL